MKHKKVKTNAIRMIEQANIPYQIHEYEWSEEELGALHVSQEMQVPLTQVYKTIVLTGDHHDYVVACISANHDINLKELAKQSQHKRLELLKLEQLEKVTGYVRGGCSPIGMKKVFPIFIEHNAQKEKTIRISGGKRGIQVELNPFDLQKLTHAKWFINEQ